MAFDKHIVVGIKDDSFYNAWYKMQVTDDDLCLKASKNITHWF